jgi:hypothetical protein
VNPWAYFSSFHQFSKRAPDSHWQELIQSLAAAQDFRVQPGGIVLQPNMPADCPVLSLQAGG